MKLINIGLPRFHKMSIRRYPYEVTFPPGDTVLMCIEIFDVDSDAERPDRSFLTVDLDAGKYVTIEGEIEDVVMPVKDSTNAIELSLRERPPSSEPVSGPEPRYHMAASREGSSTLGDFHRTTVVTPSVQRAYVAWLGKGGSQEKLLKDLEANYRKPTLPEGAAPTPPAMRR